MEPLLQSETMVVDSTDHALVSGKGDVRELVRAPPSTASLYGSTSSVCGRLQPEYQPLTYPSSQDSSKNGSGKSLLFCRICHEGDMSNCTGASPSFSANSGSSTSTASNGSSRSGSRREPLIAPCRCTGSVGMVHLSCLEHWLTSSSSDKCELCNFVYKTRKLPRTWTEFLTDSENQFNVRNMIADLVCFFLLTPLLVVSTYLCVLGAHQYYLRERWESVGLITLSIFLLMVYFTWCQVTLKYHVGIWGSWARTHQRVSIIIGNGFVECRRQGHPPEANNNFPLQFPEQV